MEVVQHDDEARGGLAQIVQQQPREPDAPSAIGQSTPQLGYGVRLAEAGIQRICQSSEQPP